MINLFIFLLPFLQCPFPFEGNWNKIIAKVEKVKRVIDLQCPFPFEGNWNAIHDLGHESIDCLTMSFPVWRELKLSGSILSSSIHPLQCPFPFEGNWNIDRPLPRTCEWKWLTMSFPVWRELKLAHTLFSSRYLCTLLQCPFPFEGNWNTCYHHHILNLDSSYNVLSRLKGIETQITRIVCVLRFLLTMSFPVWRELKPPPIARFLPRSRWAYNVLSRLKGIETFETSRASVAASASLTMSFPVWRELKRAV